MSYPATEDFQVSLLTACRSSYRDCAVYSCTQWVGQGVVDVDVIKDITKSKQ